MPDYMAPLFAEHEAIARAQVQAETWGHLAPAPRQTYTGWMVVCWSGYGGDLVVIDAQWKDLDASPWLFDDMQDRLSKWVDRETVKRGSVYRFEGTYTKFKNGNYRFSGKLRKLRIRP